MYNNEIDNMRCVYEHLVWGLVMCYDTYVFYVEKVNCVY